MMRNSAQWSLVVASLIACGGLLSYVAAPLLRGQALAPVAAPREPSSFREVAKKVLPAVVSIEAKAKPAPKVIRQSANPRRRLPDDVQVPEEFRRFFEQAEQMEMPDRTPQQGFGSGVIIDPKGVILTNNHVVAGAESVEIQMMDGRKFTSKEIFGDPKTDLAIVKLTVKDPLPFVELGDSDAMEVGDRVLAAGAPFGLKGSLSAGIVSAKGRNGLNMNMYEDFIQTDAAINPGNSGGPLVNLEGKVIAINSMIKTQSGGFQGVGLAVSSNLARSVMAQLLKDGVVKRGYLGIQIKDLTDTDLAQRLGAKDSGVLVTQVFDGSPAGKAGLQDGDVVSTIAGKPVKDSKDLRRIVAELPIGKPVDIAIVRDGKPQTLQVTIENQPENFGTTRVPLPRTPKKEPASTNVDKVGVQVTDLTPELAQQLGYKEQAKGAVVIDVERDGVAVESGIRPGMLITKVEQELVQSAASLKDALDKSSMEKGVLLQVQTPHGGTNYVLLKKETATK